MGTRARVIGCGLAAVALTGAVLAVVLGAWSVFAVKRAAAVWPEGLAALEQPEPGMPPDPQAWDRLLALMEAVPDGVDHSAIGEALKIAGQPGPVEILGPTAAACVVAMDQVVEGGGLVPPVIALDQERPDYLRLLHAARLRLLRAWRYAEQDRDAEALAEMLRVERFGLLLEHAGGNLILTMVGVAVEDEALDELLDLLAARPGVPSEALASVQAELEAGLALPAALPGAIVGECWGTEAMFDEMRHWDRERLFAAAKPGTLLPAGPAHGDGCCSPFYDPDRTIQLHRWRCAQIIAAAGEAEGARAWPEFSPLFTRGSLDPGQYLDNPVGRILLDIAVPRFSSFGEKLTRLHRRKALVTVRVALRRYTLHQADGALPPDLAALVPAFLSEVPAGISFDPVGRELSSQVGEETLTLAL